MTIEERLEHLAESLLNIEYFQYPRNKVEQYKQLLQIELQDLIDDSKRMDAIADERLVDGIGIYDIDDETLTAMKQRGSSGTEEEWKEEWRRQLRLVIDRVFRCKTRYPHTYEGDAPYCTRCGCFGPVDDPVDGRTECEAARNDRLKG